MNKFSWTQGLAVVTLLGALGGGLLAVQGGAKFPIALAKADLMAPDLSNLTTAKPPSTPHVLNADFIRVGISDDRMEAWEYPLTQLTATSNYKITDKYTGNVAFQGAAGQVVSITTSGSGFWLKSTEQETPGASAAGPWAGPLVAEPTGDGLMKIMNITRRGVNPTYRGTLEIARGYSSPLRLSVVNVLLMEDYLRAVVPNELPPRYGYEAVKAQAVAARNYAIRPREKPWPQFDICDSQACQVYFGSHTETPETNLALRETQGLVALYGANPILALYSSSHGGVAENYSYAFSDPKTNQFPASPLPYLVGGPDVPSVQKEFGDLRQEKAARIFWTSPRPQSFDVLSPYYRWERSWKKAELEATLNKTLADVSKDAFTAPFITPLFSAGDSVGSLKRVTVKERGISGKAMVVEIEGTHGKWTLKKEYVIRKVFQQNGKMLPSANIVFIPQAGVKGKFLAMKVAGGGFGHGVGMSQLGASWMSAHGFSFPEIIQHYYKGVTLGSRPLVVGAGHYTQPVQDSFFVKQAEGVLRIEAEDPTRPVQVQVNGQPVELGQLQAKGTCYGLQSLLKPGQMNTLLVSPDPQQPNREIKVWVELYPAKPEEVAVQSSPLPVVAKQALPSAEAKALKGAVKE